MARKATHELRADDLAAAAPQLDRPRAGERQAVSFRFRPGLRDRIWSVARAEQRTFSDQVNVLIERGLDADQRFADTFGSVASFAVARALVAAAEAAAIDVGAGDGRWVADPKGYGVASAAMAQVIELLRPGKLQSALAQVADERERAQAREAVEGIEHARRTARARDQRVRAR